MFKKIRDWWVKLWAPESQEDKLLKELLGIQHDLNKIHYIVNKKKLTYKLGENDKDE